MLARAAALADVLHDYYSRNRRVSLWLLNRRRTGERAEALDRALNPGSLNPGFPNPGSATSGPVKRRRTGDVAGPPEGPDPPGFGPLNPGSVNPGWAAGQGAAGGLEPGADTTEACVAEGGHSEAAAVPMVARVRRVYWERCMSGMCQDLGDLNGAATHALEVSVGHTLKPRLPKIIVKGQHCFFLVSPTRHGSSAVETGTAGRVCARVHST